ncbi:hypothetical protein ABEB36_014440 [Hypothenemus hampei]|uniref:Uncharacterized protein n=1 Tax=Hypothenemus hampei TaxID=57062 RepID=A0ABD1E230_HYPHA
MTAVSNSIDMPIKRRLRFSEQDDMALLQEVASRNPFQNSEEWEIIQQSNLTLTEKKFNVKTLKDHLDLLIKNWLKKTKLLQTKSGIEEPYSEKDQLCQNIHDYMLNFRKITSSKKPADAGKAEREKWTVVLRALTQKCSDSKKKILLSPASNKDATENVMEITFDENIENNPIVIPAEEIESNSKAPSRVLNPCRSRKRKLNVQRQGLLYLEQYDKTQFELQQKCQILEERKLALEEKKLGFEEIKFQDEQVQRSRMLDLLEKRMDMEKAEREGLMKTIDQQNKIINSILLNVQNFRT